MRSCSWLHPCFVPQLELLKKLEPDEQAREFVVLGNLAKAVPVRSLCRDDNLAKLSDVCDLIVEDVNRLEPVAVDLGTYKSNWGVPLESQAV